MVFPAKVQANMQRGGRFLKYHMADLLQDHSPAPCDGPMVLSSLELIAKTSRDAFS
jgi:hypothetical protein